MPKVDRRSVLASVGAAALGSIATPGHANAASPPLAKAIAPRGQRGIYVRQPSLELEDINAFFAGEVKWRAGKFEPAYRARAAQLFDEHGINPDKPTTADLSKILPMIESDHIMAMMGRIYYDQQYYAFMSLRDAYHARADMYLSELAAADNAGPGVFELNRSFEVPIYCRHEYHMQLGGYVGDPFAGYIYHQTFQNLFDGDIEQDQNFNAIAAACPVPEDGKVRRILDNGTGIGQVALAMKRRFPDAEVWGIDTAAPMLRYAHMRANRFGVPVNYSRRAAEANGFPDNHFDIIISTSFHHEVTEEASKKIFAEAQRSLRKGGVYRPAESGIDGYGDTPLQKIGTYLNYRWNREPWVMEWSGMDRFGAMRAAGLKLNTEGAKRGTGVTWIPGAVAWKV